MTGYKRILAFENKCRFLVSIPDRSSSRDVTSALEKPSALCSSSSTSSSTSFANRETTRCVALGVLAVVLGNSTVNKLATSEELHSNNTLIEKNLGTHQQLFLNANGRTRTKEQKGRRRRTGSNRVRMKN